jgi:serine phosphatase RsbU (regulator of sigma subunit)
MPILHVLSGPGAGRVFEFSQPEIVVGRDPHCDFTLSSRTVSRQHAAIRRRADAWYLEDLRSVNGTVVNGRRVTGPARLEDNDRVRIHDIVMAFYMRLPCAPLDGDDMTSVSASESAPSEASGPTGRGDSWLERARTEFSSNGAVREATSAELDSGTVVTKLDSRSYAPGNLEANADVKLRAVLEIARTLGSSLDCDVVLGRILESLFRIFPQSNRGYILLADDPTGPIRTSAARHQGNPSDTISPIDSSLARRVMADGVAFVSGERAADEADEAMVFDEPRSVMCAPLVSPSHAPLGVIQIESLEPNYHYSRQDLDVLASVAFLAGQAVENSRLHRVQLDLESRRRQMDLAASVQSRFLPQDPPRLEGYEFQHHYRAADYVAGDYFDYIELPDGRLAFAQGDVCGKGMAAALLMAHLCSDVRSCLLATSQPAAAVNRLNKRLSRQLPPGSFITLVLGVIDPRAHTLTLVNAAHMPPLRREAATGDVAPLGAEYARPPLGIDSKTKYMECVVPLAPGDAVVFYTDGVSDAQNRAGASYGTESLERILRSHGGSARQLMGAVITDISGFVQDQPQTDDICLICCRRSE